MVRASLIVLASIIVASPAYAQSEQVRRGPAPIWAAPSALLPLPEAVSGPLFVRRNDLEVHLGDDGEAQYVGYRIKILDSSALQLGNISIAWNPINGAPIIHEIKLFRDGQVIDALKDSSFEILRREDQLEAARLDGTLTAVLRVPDLRVGDELEVDLTTFAKDPTLGRNYSGLLTLAPNPSPGRYHLGLSWEQGHQPNLKATPDLTAAMLKGERAVDLRWDNPASTSPPKDAPMRYRWQRVLEYTDFADWAALSRHFAPLYVKAATLAADSAIKREASRIAAAHASPLERASAALKLVQQDVRYIYVGLNGGNLTPAKADETWQRRYGDCKGKTTLLLALLAELGIEAEPVLVSTSSIDDGLDQRLPLPDFFDHVLVRARIDGATYWLDGTLPPVAGPSPRPVFPVNWVLPLTARGSGIEKLGWELESTPDEINLFEIDARVGFDKPARIVSTQIVRGLEGLKQQIQFSSLTAGQILEAYRQTAIGDTWQAIDDVQWRYDSNARASILTISGTGIVNWENEGSGGKSLALPGGGFSPPERRVRAAGQDINLPFYTKPEYVCEVTTVRLPNSTQAQQWSSKASFDTELFGRRYHRAWELRDGSIRMVRGSRIEEPEIDAATAQRDNGRIAAFDNSMGWITYDPTRRKASVGNGETVPATYDFDWTANDVPCASRPDQPKKAQETAAPPDSEPATAGEYLDRGNARLNARAYDDALADFKEAAKLNPASDMAVADMAVAYALKGDFQSARADIDAALKMNPDQIVARDAQGIVALRHNRWQEAIEAYSAALKVSPNDEFALLQRGYAYLGAGDVKRALADSEAYRGVSINNSNGYLLQAQIYLRKAQIDLSKPDADRAIAFIDKLAALNTDDAQAVKTALEPLREAAKRIETALVGYEQDKRAKVKR
jgi:Tfp pilus assembly protein PilF